MLPTPLKHQDAHAGNRGLSILELMMVTAVIGFIAMAMASLSTTERKAHGLISAALYREHTLAYLKTIAEDRRSVMASMARNQSISDCAQSLFGGGSLCIINGDHPINLYSAARDGRVAGTPDDPVYYNRDGARCTKTKEHCDFAATAGFMPVCREDPPAGAVACTVAALAIYVKIEDLRPLDKSFQKSVEASTQDVLYSLYDTRTLLPWELECVTGERTWDSPNPTVSVGNPAAVVSMGAASAAMGAWGISCAPGYIRTSCAYNDHKNDWDALEKDVLMSTNGCYSTTDSHAAQGVLHIRCCRLE